MTWLTYVAFGVAIAIASFMLGRAKRQRSVLLLCIGALLATGAIALARDLVPLSLGAIFSFCVTWLPFASLLYIAGLQDWRKPTQQELETRARKKREADAQWAKWRSSRPNADEPEHWIFKRASEPNPYDEPKTTKKRR